MMSEWSPKEVGDKLALWVDPSKPNGGQKVAPSIDEQLKELMSKVQADDDPRKCVVWSEVDHDGTKWLEYDRMLAGSDYILKDGDGGIAWATGAPKHCAVTGE